LVAAVGAWGRSVALLSYNGRQCSIHYVVM
jgi:hypothetical protein